MKRYDDLAGESGGATPLGKAPEVPQVSSLCLNVFLFEVCRASLRDDSIRVFSSLFRFFQCCFRLVSLLETMRSRYASSSVYFDCSCSFVTNWITLYSDLLRFLFFFCAAQEIMGRIGSGFGSLRRVHALCYFFFFPGYFVSR